MIETRAEMLVRKLKNQRAIKRGQQKTARYFAIKQILRGIKHV